MKLLILVIAASFQLLVLIGMFHSIKTKPGISLLVNVACTVAATIVVAFINYFLFGIGAAFMGFLVGYGIGMIYAWGYKHYLF